MGRVECIAGIVDQHNPLAGEIIDPIGQVTEIVLFKGYDVPAKVPA